MVGDACGIGNYRLMSGPTVGKWTCNLTLTNGVKTLSIPFVYHVNRIENIDESIPQSNREWDHLIAGSR